jgi:hypothetical protein
MASIIHNASLILPLLGQRGETGEFPYFFHLIAIPDFIFSFFKKAARGRWRRKERNPQALGTIKGLRTGLRQFGHLNLMVALSKIRGFDKLPSPQATINRAAFANRRTSSAG